VLMARPAGFESGLPIPAATSGGDSEGRRVVLAQFEADPDLSGDDEEFDPAAAGAVAGFIAIYVAFLFFFFLMQQFIMVKTTNYTLTHTTLGSCRLFSDMRFRDVAWIMLSNLFLIVETNFPNGKGFKDTLEYVMAKPNGEFLGTGFSDIKENKLWYREGVVFDEDGEYQVNIQHAMRKSGSVRGLENLEGIIDVGFRIEKTTD